MTYVAGLVRKNCNKYVIGYAPVGWLPAEFAFQGRPTDNEHKNVTKNYCTDLKMNKTRGDIFR